MAGSVVACDPRAIEYERHPRAMERTVHEDLVEGPVQERGVERNDGVKSAKGKARSTGHRMLLCDADVVNAIRERSRTRPGR